MQSTVLSRTRIRPRQPADDDFIVRLSLRAFAEFSSDPGRSTLRMARAASTLIAERDEQPAGFAVVHFAAGDSVELRAIAVDERVRGQGVGAVLLAAVERAAAEAGARELTLHTAVANLAALELFLKHGFRTKQRLPRFYRDVFDAVRMRKRL